MFRAIRSSEARNSPNVLFPAKTISRIISKDHESPITSSEKDASSLTSDWPELPYGGKIEIFEALNAEYPSAGSDAYILKLFAEIRTQLLTVIREMPNSLLGYIPQGFNNNLHWQAGHVLTITDELIFTYSGNGSRIPPDYKTFFARGTSPSNWIDSPPEIDGILKRLEDQTAEICTTFSGKLTQPAADPDNFL